MKLASAFLDFALLVSTVQAQSLPTPIPAGTTRPGAPLHGTSWYWQLSGQVIASHDAAKLYDIDLEESSPTLIKKLQDAGHTVICYFSAGSYEPWRSDAAQFPTSSIGKKLGQR